VALLAGSGWWFVQDALTVGLPLLAAGAVIATVVAGPRLIRGDMDAPATALALFGAGFASAAGPAVTLLSGYAVTWSVALITLALVGLVTTLAGRVLAVARLRTPAVASLAALVVGVGLGFAAPSAADLGGGPAGGTADVGLPRGPASPDVGGMTRRFTLTAKTATVALASGRTIAAWTFNGQLPGPALAAVQGDLIEVTLRNADIQAGVTLHWHGYDVPAGEDGVPGLTQEAVLPGQEFVYRFRAAQTGTYWYHTHEVSDRGVKLGLFGSLVVSPRGTGAPGVDLTVPVHTLGGALAFGTDDRPTTRAVPPGTPVRLRLINTDDVPRVLGLAGTAFRVVATDGTDLNAPDEVSRIGLRVPAGGRYDLAFTMPTAAVALRPTNGSAALNLTPDAAATPPTDTPDSSTVDSWPLLDLLTYGRPAPVPFDTHSAFDRRFILVLDRGLALVGGTPTYAFTVNGRAYPDIPIEQVREGDLVEFTVVNRSRDTHPWHLHGHHVLVLSRDGVAPGGSPLWLDTFDVRPGEVWRVAFRADNPGLWMNHCHNLSHADKGMMLELAYAGVREPPSHTSHH